MPLPRPQRLLMAQCAEALPGCSPVRPPFPPASPARKTAAACAQKGGCWVAHTIPPHLQGLLAAASSSWRRSCAGGGVVNRPGVARALVRAPGARAGGGRTCPAPVWRVGSRCAGARAARRELRRCASQTAVCSNTKKVIPLRQPTLSARVSLILLAPPRGFAAELPLTRVPASHITVPVVRFALSRVRYSGGWESESPAEYQQAGHDRKRVSIVVLKRTPGRRIACRGIQDRSSRATSTVLVLSLQW